jgi:hypothetical protein
VATNTTATYEGVSIGALTAAQLEAAEKRCNRYFERCDAAGHDPEKRYVEMCLAIGLEINRRATYPGTIADAFGNFSMLRAIAAGYGYTVPSIEGTPGIAEIERACEALRQAIAAYEENSGAVSELADAEFYEHNEEITATIAEINAPAQEQQRRPGE